MTSDRPGTRPIGPGRFQQPQAESDGPGRAASLGAAALLLLLVVGVPAALVTLGGLPHVPTSLPTRGELTEAIGAAQLLAILVWVVWLAWLQFTICVAVELRSALSGVGLPTRVPLAGPSQKFARTLVVTVLLLVTAAGQASAVTVNMLAPQHATTAATSTAVAGAAGSAAGTADLESAWSAGSAGTTATNLQGSAAAKTADQGQTTYWLGDVQLSAAEGAELLGKRVYVVQPPEGRYHDNLWDISERTLGDGRRYQEVFNLNKGRDQPDGQQLTLERLIYPNWLLVMPEDAPGVARVTAVVAPVTAEPAGPAGEVAPAADPGATSALADATQTGDVSDIQTGARAASGDEHAVVASSSSSIDPRGLVGAGLLAAGLVVAVERLRRRRRTSEPSEEGVEMEVALRVGADPARAALLDRGLRQLAAALHGAGRDLPGVYSVLVADTTVELRLAPPAGDAPAPWRAQASGASWHLDAGDVDLHTGAGPAPFPGLVSLGRDEEGRDVLIDLEAAQGPVSIAGDLDVARQVATAIAAELATNRWSDHLHVTGVGLPEGLLALPPERYRAVASPADALVGLRERRADALGAGVLTGRMRSGGSPDWIGEYLVLGSVPTDGTVHQLVELAATAQRSPLGVVCVGDLPGARWQLVAEADGRLTGRLLDLNVQANRLTARQISAVAELLTPAPEPARVVDERRAAVEHEGAVERPPVSAPDRVLEPGDLDRAAVRVYVLGLPRVETVPAIDETRRALATELVVFLALHPGGVHANVLAAALWPRGVTTEVRESTFTRAIQWLGVDASGRQHLLRSDEGHLRLGDGVVVDWDVVRSLLARSRQAPGPDQERAALRAALRLSPGSVLSAHPAGRYSWLARIRLERASRALLIDATHRLVVLSRDDGDPAAAQTVAWKGLALAPTEELLWRDLLRAAAVLDGAPAVHQVATDLAATLRGAGVAGMSAATSALLEELAPSVTSLDPTSLAPSS